MFSIPSDASPVTGLIIGDVVGIPSMRKIDARPPGVVVGRQRRALKRRFELVCANHMSVEGPQLSATMDLTGKEPAGIEVLADSDLCIGGWQSASVAAQQINYAHGDEEQRARHGKEALSVHLGLKSA